MTPARLPDPGAAVPATFQQRFWHDLWAAPTADADTPWARQPGFAVYRNTVLKGCIDALVAQYPAVHRLIGDDALRALARDHTRAHPPTDGRQHVYGAHLPDHLAATRPADGSLDWLPDVARLDRLWTECHVAADAPVLDAATLLSRDPEALAHTHLVPHPAARWRWCAAWPAFDLWSAARDGRADPNPPRWCGQGALLTRPHGAVDAVEIGAGAVAFLDACAARLPFPAALASAQATDPALDLGATLALLLGHGAFSETVDEHPDPPSGTLAVA